MSPTTKTVKTVCPYCGVGCGMLLEVRDNKIIRVTGDKSHPANYGRLCTKGQTVKDTLHGPTRLHEFRTRKSIDSEFISVSTEAGLDNVAQSLRSVIDRYGPQSVAFYLSGQIATEAQYLANKLAKGFLRTNSVESNSRLCMASAASGYKLSLGADAPPGCYEDFDEADAFFVIGANMADCHPILFQRMNARRKESGAKLIVVDPRQTATAQAADLYLPIRPGSDLALLNALLHCFIRDGRIDPSFIASNTQGWAATANSLAEWTPTRAAADTALPASRIEEAAAILGSSGKWMSLWTMGLNQSTNGTAHTQAICNLHLATGTIGKPGCGPFSLTGQPNAMGGREMGYFFNGLPGQRSITSAKDRTFCEAVWGVPEGTIIPEVGLHTVEFAEAMANGTIKALWVIGSNPVATLPKRDRFVEGLRAAELVIVQDAYFPTETGRYAHHLLPGALWAEAEGSMVNSDRTVTLMQAALEPTGDTHADWWLIAEVARRMGYGASFDYQSASDVFDEIKLFHNPQTGWDYRGMSYTRLREKPLRWPCPDENSLGIARRYLSTTGTDTLTFATADGCARFAPAKAPEPAETADVHFPFILNTGRLPHQWHTRTKTGLVEALNKLNPGPFLEINPFDAKQLGISEGKSLAVESRRGRCVLPVRITQDVRPGQLFAPFHWNDEFAKGICVNAATNDACDPVSFQPELKLSAVKLTVVAEPSQAESQSVNERVQALAALFEEGLLSSARSQRNRPVHQHIVTTLRDMHTKTTTNQAPL